MAARPRGHKQRKLNDNVYPFALFACSRPRCHAEFYHIERSLLADNWHVSKQGIEVSAEHYHVTISQTQV